MAFLGQYVGVATNSDHVETELKAVVAIDGVASGQQELRLHKD